MLGEESAGVEKDQFLKSFDCKTTDFDFSPNHTGMPSESYRSMSSVVRTGVLANTVLCASDMNNESRHGEH